MTTASDTQNTELPVETGIREWCCGTPITEPHATGCSYDPTPENPIDYDGPAVVVESTADEPAEDASAEDTGWKHPEPDEWKHQWLPFHGDLLAIRIPTNAALTGYQVSQSGTNSEAFRVAATNRFITRHMSPETYARVIDRLMDPDDEDYTEETLGELIDAIAEPAVARFKKEAEERAKVAR